MTQEGQSTNLQFQGFVRPSAEALQALSSLEETIKSYRFVLNEKPTNIRVVSDYFWGVLFSGNLDQTFTVNYAVLSRRFDISAEYLREVLTDAVKSGYFKMLAVGNRGQSSLYAINWRQPTAAE